MGYLCTPRVRIKCCIVPFAKYLVPCNVMTPKTGFRLICSSIALLLKIAGDQTATPSTHNVRHKKETILEILSIDNFTVSL